MNSKMPGKMPCLLWRAPPPYSQLACSASIGGLKIIAHRHLVVSRLFDYGGNAWFGDRFDSLPGHLGWILANKQLVDVSEMPCWQLLDLRANAMKAGADEATLRQMDDTLGFYVRSTMMAPHVYWADKPPGIPEWFIEADDRQPYPAPSTKETVHYIVQRRLAEQLSLLQSAISLILYNQLGRDVSERPDGSVAGTFIVRSVPAV